MRAQSVFEFFRCCCVSCCVDVRSISTRCLCVSTPLCAIERVRVFILAAERRGGGWGGPHVAVRLIAAPWDAIYAHERRRAANYGIYWRIEFNCKHVHMRTNTHATRGLINYNQLSGLCKRKGGTVTLVNKALAPGPLFFFVKTRNIYEWSAHGIPRSHTRDCDLMRARVCVCGMGPPLHLKGEHCGHKHRSITAKTFPECTTHERARPRPRQRQRYINVNSKSRNHNVHNLNITGNAI